MKMRLHELLFVALVFGWAMCGPACSHQALAPPASHGGVRSLSSCLNACPGASAVITAEVPETGHMCRCWAPNAFSYTFSYPESEADFDYVKQRWVAGMKAANACRAQGLGWEPDQTRDNVVCVKPSVHQPAPFDPNKHAALGRLRLGDWPRFVHRPAWMLWLSPSRAS